MGKERGGQAAIAPAATAPKLSEAEIRQIGEDTRRMDVHERIAYWDKRQGAIERVDADGQLVESVLVRRTLPDGSMVEERAWPAGSTFQRARTVILCGADPKHGPLFPHGDGTRMICQQRAPGDRQSFCSYTMPLSV